MVTVVAVVFESCVVSAHVVARFGKSAAVEGLLYSPTVGRLDVTELAERETAACGRLVTVAEISAAILARAAQLSAVAA